jgi:hypothetical protein
MVKGKKSYETPVVAALGNVQDVTHALFWSGSGDILSGFVEENLGIDVDNGCSDFTSSFCSTGS